MAPERATSTRPCTAGHAEIRLEPKGVIGNIVPWNFPFDLGLGPLSTPSRPATG